MAKNRIITRILSIVVKESGISWARMKSHFRNILKFDALQLIMAGQFFIVSEIVTSCQGC